MKISRAITIVVAILTLALLAFASPVIYNQYLDPLARLKSSIVVGEERSAVEARFLGFLSGHPEAQFSNGITTHHILRGLITPTEHLFLYHVNVFDDIQLQVLFDKDKKVREIAFIGD